MAGWQNSLHGVSKQDLAAMNSGQTQTAADIGQNNGGIEGRARTQNNIVKNAQNISEKIYVDANVTAGAGRGGLTAGIQINSEGAYAYGGIGLGSLEPSVGASLTVNYGTVSEGMSFGATVSGGNVMGGKFSVTYGEKSTSVSGGVGIGVGMSATVTDDKTIKILSFRRK